MFDINQFALGPNREIADEVRIRYYSGGPDDRHDTAILLRASGRASVGQAEIAVERHVVISYTPCGAWIDTWEGKRFVNLRAGKQWASTTEAEAIDQLYHRKRAQVRILASRLAEAETVLTAMEQHLGKKPPAPRPFRGSSDSDYC